MGAQGAVLPDTDAMVFYFRAYSYVAQCQKYACYCRVAVAPPPPPGQCGTDFCGCANPDGLGGYAICPGHGGCANHPNRCMTHLGSVCLPDWRRNGVCSHLAPPAAPPAA